MFAGSAVADIGSGAFSVYSMPSSGAVGYGTPGYASLSLLIGRCLPVSGSKTRVVCVLKRFELAIW
jgi:hypothetical protein